MAIVEAGDRCQTEQEPHRDGWESRPARGVERSSTNSSAAASSTKPSGPAKRPSTGTASRAAGTRASSRTDPACSKGATRRGRVFTRPARPDGVPRLPSGHAHVQRPQGWAHADSRMSVHRQPSRGRRGSRRGRCQGRIARMSHAAPSRRAWAAFAWGGGVYAAAHVPALANALPFLEVAKGPLGYRLARRRGPRLRLALRPADP